MSHHPAVSSFLIEHCDKDYKIYGNFEEKFKRNGNDLEFRIEGPTYIEFHDGDIYSIKWPAKYLENYVYMKYEEHILVEKVDSSLCSVVFLGDTQEGGPFAITGAVYN